MSQFKVDLILPRRNFNCGDLLPFEVKLENPEAIPIYSMSISLKQNTFYIKNRGKSTREPAPLKMKSTTIVYLSRFPIYDDVVENQNGVDQNWTGALQIPPDLPRFGNSSAPKVGTEQISSIQYVLQVNVNKSENQLSELFPIQIRIARNSPPVRATSAGASSGSSASRGNANAMPPPRGSESSRSRPPRESSRLSDFGALEPNFDAARRLGDLGELDCPPRYSMLSLPTIGSSRSSSLETLPPHYEDIGLQ